MRSDDKEPKAWEPTRDTMLVSAWIVILAVGSILAWTLVGEGLLRAASPAMDRRRAAEQRADDASWIVLKDAARKHLAAVRSDAARLPGEELGDALLDYSQNGRRIWRTPRSDPTDRLAALMEAADRLDASTRRIRCINPVEARDAPSCRRYVRALVEVFGRDL